jgi:nicotinamidase-related amidase
MPLTQLDEVAALVIIDLQKCIVSLPCAHPTSEIVERSAQLARAFRARGLPVVLVNVSGAAPGRTDTKRTQMVPSADWTELVPELGQQQDDVVLTKQRRGAFIGTSLDEVLRQRGVTQIFLTGVATSSGVEATAWSGSDYGYNLVFITDSMTDSESEAHEYCVDKIFSRLGETALTENVVNLLNRYTVTTSALIEG